MKDPEERAPRVTALEADRLAEGRRVRGLPPPPGSVLAEDPRDDPHYDEVVAGTVAPHWNSAVELLRQGPDGYLAPVRMRDRIAAHLDRDRRAFERAGIVDNVARRVSAVVEREGARHGADATVGESVQSGDRSADVWEWVPEATILQPQRELDAGGPPQRYRLRDPEVDVLLAEYDALRDGTADAFPLGLTSFSSGDTWSGCARTVSGETWAYRRPAHEEWRDRRVDLVEFRLSVVEQVLREHEVLGYVGEFGEAPRPVDLDEEQETFLHAALAAIAQVEDSERTPSWYAATNLVSDSTGWSRSKIERVAEGRFGAFEKRVGETKPTDQQQRDRYDLFKRQVVGFARAAGLDLGEAGFNDSNYPE